MTNLSIDTDTPQVKLIGYPPSPRSIEGYEFGYLDPAVHLALEQKGWRFFEMRPTAALKLNTKIAEWHNQNTAAWLFENGGEE